MSVHIPNLIDEAKCFETVRHIRVRVRGKALLGALIGLLVSPP